MINLIKYLDDNKIAWSSHDDYFVTINEEVYFLVEPNKEGMVFSPGFTLLTEEKGCDKYIYFFGEKWYWENKADKEQPKLNELKYIGDMVQNMATEHFLGVRGAYEILNGSRMYEDWCRKAKFMQCRTLGICEKNTLGGVLKFQLACQAAGIKPVIGATYTVFRESQDLRYDVKLYVKNEQGWSNILMVNKEVNVLNDKFIREERLVELLDGLFFVVDPKSLPYLKINHVILRRIDFYQMDSIEFINNDRDKEYLENLKGYKCNIANPVAITDAFYLDAEDAHIKKTLNGISGVRESESNNQYFKNKDTYFSELEVLFRLDDDSLYDLLHKSLMNEQRIAEECNFKVTIGERFLPAYEMTPEESSKFKTNEDLFWYLIDDGLRRKVTRDKDVNIYLSRVETEFDVINKGNVIDYFLILWDIIAYARNNDILVGIGRGSAGGSIIAYFLDIIQLDPIEFDLLFERFLNEGRIVKSLPDIDTDFPGTKREMIKEYMEFRYGKNQVCSVGTYTALQVKASIKDLSKQYGLDFGEVNQITTLLPNMKTIIELFDYCGQDKRVKSFVKDNVKLINDIRLVLHQPKAKSVHACAMLILPKEKDMFQWLPIVNLDGQMVSEWEGIELETAGFLKEDILGIQQLDKFENIISLIKANKGVDINIYAIPYTDRRVYKYFSKGWNEDTFHFGSRGLTGYCRDLQPENIEDLIAAISLYRPGAMENNFHNEYVLRKTGKRQVDYITGGEEIMETTFGVFCYQEQIMKLCQVLGGLSLVEADDVRKAMVKKKYSELTKYKDRFIPYYVETFHVTQKYSEDVWDTIDKASTYLFNRSHAAAYAITGYISQWFKVNYPVEYWSTAFKFSEEKDHARYIAEIDQVGSINIMPADINNSRNDVYTDFVTKTIYWPLISIKQCGEVATKQIIDVKDKDGQFFSFEEFLIRNRFKGGKVGKVVIENLIMAGAFDELEKIESPNVRYRLIKQFYDLAKVSVEVDKNIFEVNSSKLTENWWWTLQQKRLSGIAFFDYPDLLEKYMESDNDIINIDDFQLDSSARRKVRVGGYITEVQERTNKKGKWLQVVIECNYNFIEVSIGSEHYNQLMELDILNKCKSILLISGQIVYSSYKKQNTLQTCDDTELLILE